jgi:hypothetical protein
VHDGLPQLHAVQHGCDGPTAQGGEVCGAPDATVAVAVRHGDQRAPDVGGHAVLSELPFRHESVRIFYISVRIFYISVRINLFCVESLTQTSLTVVE